MAIKDVVVDISKQQIPGNTGLGTPLVIAGGAEKTVPFTECRKIEDVEAAGFTAETEVHKQCEAVFAQKNRPRVAAVCATEGKIGEKLEELKAHSFRQIIPILGEGENLTELAGVIEKTKDKMLFIKVSDVSELPEEKYDRTFAIVYKGKSPGVEGAVVGASAGYKAGEITYKNLILAGIEPEDLAGEKVDAIHKAGAVCILKKVGDVVTSEGFVLSGEYADVIDSIDFIVNNIAYKSQKLLNDNPKIPYSDIGISQLEAVTYGVLSAAYQQGIIDVTDKGDPDFRTKFLKRSECPSDEIRERIYNGGYFEFGIMSAIHYAKISGLLTV